MSSIPLLTEVTMRRLTEVTMRLGYPLLVIMVFVSTGCVGELNEGGEDTLPPFVTPDAGVEVAVATDSGGDFSSDSAPPPVGSCDTSDLQWTNTSLSESFSEAMTA